MNTKNLRRLIKEEIEIQEILSKVKRIDNASDEEIIKILNKILEETRLKNIRIDDDGYVNVNGDVDIRSMKLIKIPFYFGVINGDFDCSNNKLTSLHGAPKRVGGHFRCGFNRLTSLKGVPKKFNREFRCGHNQLTSLVGAPKIVGGIFECSNNKLTSLVGAPKIVGGNFYCVSNDEKQFTEKDVRRICNVKGKIIVNVY